MKINFFSKCLTFLFSALLILSSLSVYISAETQTDKEIELVIEYYLERETAGSVQDFLDNYLSKNAGSGNSEWLVVALRQFRHDSELDFSKYSDSLDKYIKDEPVIKATDRQRIELAYAASGKDPTHTEAAVADTAGKLGVMSDIYGLILLDSIKEIDNGQLKNRTLNSIVGSFIPDGGWALMGPVPDIDVTAMALQALAPYREEISIKPLIEKALSFLAEKQNENGSFASWGTVNCESTAQVIMALNALAIPLSDERFIKNGNDLMDALLLFKKDDNSFSHTVGSNSNDTATAQAFLALVSVWRTQNGYGKIYDFTQKVITIKPEESWSSSVSEAQSSTISEKAKTSGSDIKTYIFVLLGVVFTVTLLGFTYTKRLNKKNITVLLVVFAMLFFAISLSSFLKPDEFYAKQNSTEDSDFKTDKKVHLSIRCDAVYKTQPDASLPYNGTILPKTEYTLLEGDTAFSMISRAAAEKKIKIDYSKNLSSVYIKGVDTLYEADYGAISGWMYYVNGKKPDISCGEYILNDGDYLELVYSCNMGEDFSE